MDEVFGRVGGRFKISLIDSTMMWIVHRAMDKAHERAQTKEGVIECLTEISKFYELAVMQLEGCLKFVQEETDNSFESSDEEVLGDLAEIRDRLVGRLKESELAIAEKDRELAWRLQNEKKLIKALEMKERQLDSLHAKLKLEPTKSNEGIEELIHGNKVGVDENQLGGEEEFSGLKHSVEQQVWNIKQKLEPECKFERRRNKSYDSLTIEQMASDIDILKETMDIAFGKMQSAIFMSEMEPVEQQWRLTIERDALAILIKGFMRDIQKNIQAQVRDQKKQVSCGLSMHLSDLMKEMKCLHDELDALCLSESNHEGNNLLKPRGRSPAEEDKHMKPKLLHLSEEKDSEDDGGSNYVAKLIKSHESIIKRKNKELNTLKRENSGEKGSHARREEDFATSKRRIQDVIEIIQNLDTWNAQLGENYEDYEGDGDVKGSSTKTLCNFHTTQQEGSHIENSQVNNIPTSDAVNEVIQNEIRILKEEKEDATLQTMIIEQTCAAFWKGFVYESSSRYDSEILRRKGTHEDFLKKMVTEWNEQMETYKIDFQIREEIQYIVLLEAMKNFDSILNSTLIECQDARAEIFRLQDNNLEGKLREDITQVLLREICKEWNEFVERTHAENISMEERNQIEFDETLRDIRNSTAHKISKFKEVNLEAKLREETSRFLFRELWEEWNEVIERSDTENLVREDAYHIALQETLRNVALPGNFPENKHNEVKNSESNGMHDLSFQLIEHSVKEDVYMVFLKEMSKEWEKEKDAHNLESLIKEEIFLLCVSEAILEANSAAQDHFNISEDFISSNKLHKIQQLNREDILINKEDSQMKGIKLEEGFIQSMSSASESKECNNAPRNISQLKHKKLDKSKISREFLTEMGSTVNSVSSKVEKALDQLTVSMAIVNELRCCLGASGETDHKSFVASAHNTKPPRLPQKEIKRVNLTPPYSAFTPFMEFSQVFMDFKCTVEEKLKLNILRLEETIQHLNPLAELVSRKRREERLYRNAFISRCENLRKAETEVDMLGNQVEVLLALLEKIYIVLHHYSPVLKNYFEVSNILKMIKKELGGELLGSSEILIDC